MNLLVRLARAFAALAITAGLSVGVPWALVTCIGSPVPKRWPSFHLVARWMSTGFDIHVFIGVVVYVLWACWAVFVAQLLVQVPGVVSDIVAIARHREPTDRRAAGPGGALARGLIAAFTIALLAPRGVSTAAAAAKASSYVLSPSAATALCAPAVPGARAEAVHVVKPDETLWGIAEKQLGSPERWHDIFQLNVGAPQSDGRTLSDPQLILPGWKLWLPNGSHSGTTRGVPSAAAVSTSSNALSSGSDQASDPQEHLIRVPQVDRAAPPVPLPVQIPGSAAPVLPAPSSSEEHIAPVTRIAPRDRTAIHLPGGGLVPIALASGVAGALALARLRSRANARMRPIDDEEPDLVPQAPAPVPAALLRAHHATLCAPGKGLFHDDDMADEPYTDESPANDSENQGVEPVDGTWSLSARPHDQARPAAFAPSVRAVLEAVEASDEIHVAVRDNGPILLSSVTELGLGLTGEGALDSARSLFTCTLAAGGPRVLDQASEIHTTRRVMDDLFGSGVNVPDTARLTVFATLSELLDDAVRANDARIAELAEYGHTSAEDVRRFERLNPFHPRVLLLPLEIAERHRLDAVARASIATDTHVVLLGPWPAGTTATIGADRLVAAEGTNAVTLHGTTAFGMTAEETAQVLEALDVAWNPDTNREPFTDSAALDGQASPALLEASDVELEETPRPTTHLAAVPMTHHAKPSSGVLMLNLMGPFTAQIDDQDVTAGFQPAHRTLLLYLALRRRPVPRAEITDTLWIDEDRGDEKAKAKRKTRFDSRLYQTKKAMAKAAGREGEFIVAGQGLVALNNALVTTDLGLFDDLVNRATKASDDAERISYLEAACALYRGPLDESIRGDWLLEHREDRLRRYRDAAGDLARLVGRTDRDRGLAILNTLLEHDLFNEDLYRRIMRGQAELKRFDAVRRTFNLLETRFEAAGMEVDPDTRAMVQALTRRRVA